MSVTVYERESLTRDIVKASTTTDAQGRFVAPWSETATPRTPWDIFVRGVDTSTHGSVDSPLINDPDTTPITVDLVLGGGSYRGRSEWERLHDKLAPSLGSACPEDVGADRLEWLARRADVFPTHLAFYIQAHRLAGDRTIAASSCYAFLRAGLGPDLLALLRAGPSAWESALRAGWANRIIPDPCDGSAATLDAAVAHALEAMRELVVDAAVTAPASGVNQRVILDQVGLSVAEQREFTELWLARSGSLPEFWDAVRCSCTLGPAKAADLQFVLEAAPLLGYHIAALTALGRERTAGAITTVADTAAWDVARWDAMLVARAIEAPEGTPGEDATQRRQHYARGLARAIEVRYPTASLRHRVAADHAQAVAPPHTANLVGFLDANPSFDIGTSNIARWLATNPRALVAASDPVQARAELELVQRVYRLAPPIGRYAASNVLLQASVESAADVVGRTRAEFISEFAPRLPSDDHEPDALAGYVWDNAAKIHASTVATISTLALGKPLFKVGKLTPLEGDGLEDLSAVLAALDYCACEACRSVLSPAAYLADLLHFVKERSSAAFKELTSRRPDLTRILLDCRNTNTLLPTIDLVNELLEAEFVGSPVGRQTTWTAEELRLQPEHTLAGVYEGAPGQHSQVSITTLVHPWELPFSLPDLEAQVYLQQAGFPRHELMQRLLDSSSDPATPSASARTAAALGMSVVERAIIAGEYQGDPVDPAWDGRVCWGFAAGTDHWVGVLSGTHADEGDVGELLRRAGIELEELAKLIDLTFIDPFTYSDVGPMYLVYGESCQIEDAQVVNLGAGALDRLHRFVRLQRRTGIDARSLNVLVDDLGGLDGAFLDKLVDIRWLHERFGLPYDELATWWAARMDARKYAEGPLALYRRRFYAPELGVPTRFLPNDPGTVLVGETALHPPPLSEHWSTIAAGTGLTAPELEAVRAAGLADETFSFATITAYFRTASFARALRLSVHELIAFLELTGIDPFASPAQARRCIETLDDVRRSGFSLAELQWLLRHPAALEPRFQDDGANAALLARLTLNRIGLDAEVALLHDPTGFGIRTNLESMLPSARVLEAMAILDKSSALEEAKQAEFVDQYFAGFTDPATAQANLVTAGGELVATEERYTWLLRQFVRARRREALVLDTLASALSLTPAVVRVLIVDLLSVGDTPVSEVFSAEFASEAEATDGLTRDLYPVPFAGLEKLRKAALLVRKGSVAAEELAWYFSGSPWLNLDILPLNTGEPPASFSGWHRTFQALGLRPLFSAAASVHRQLAGAPDLDKALALLGEQTGWDSSQSTGLGFLAAKFGWTSPSIFADEAVLVRLRAIFLAVDRLGVSASVLWVWVHQPMTMARVAQIRQATRARFDARQWPVVVQPLRDSLRARQRDALVAALLADDSGLRTPTDVSEKLLIDVEISPCMLTSRIVQATAAVQTFVHRVQLGLERPLAFHASVAERWAWMKNYRVWEANRKVFLYPENWLEPQLRRNKTPQFAQLESSLAQAELNEAAVERAVLEYVEQLEKVAKLEVLASYTEPVVYALAGPIYEPENDLWVLARTQAQPRRHYLRRRHLGAWEPWTEIPLQIATDNVVVVVYEARVYLFWLTHDAATDAVGEKKSQYDLDRLMIGWSEKLPEGWSEPRLSAERLVPRPKFGTIVLDSRYLLKTLVGPLGIDLQVYAVPPNALPNAAWIVHTFRYDPAHRRVVFQHKSAPSQVPLDISLPTGAGVNGQRFTQNGHSLTEFRQGSAKGTMLFPSKAFARGVVLQSNHWGVTHFYPPSWYDDHDHKYMIVPHWEPAQAGDHTSLASMGSSLLPLFAGAALPAPSESLDFASQEFAAIQVIQDDVELVEPWQVTIPGVKPALLEFAEAPAFWAIDGAAALLEHGKTVLNAPVDQGQTSGGGPGVPTSTIRLANFHHPYVGLLGRAVNRHGVWGIYEPKDPNLVRQAAHALVLEKDGLYANPLFVRRPFPVDDFDFSPDGAYAQYNWELFLHIPLLIAGRLRTDRRFAEAQRWLHSIFNPLDPIEEPGEEPGEPSLSRFWRVRPLVDQAEQQHVDQLYARLGIGVTQAEQAIAVAQFAVDVNNWLAHPFDPHAVARVRPGAHLRAVMMKYFDTLLAWADDLFRQDSRESVNEAILLYMLVAELLGPRPRELPQPAGPAKTWAQLDAAKLDAFSNAAVALENWVVVPQNQPQLLEGDVPQSDMHKVPLRFWYFCYPPNPKLLEYWDRVEDRLWKIRHCQDIDGVTRSLALFQAPIDPALLVQANAAGLDLASVLAELDAGLGPYRFRSMLGRAFDLCGELRNLGGALVSAIEKRDSEALARLRAEHEVSSMARIRSVRALQIEEVSAQIDSLQEALATTCARERHYEQLLDNGLIAGEQANLDLQRAGRDFAYNAESLQFLASVVGLFPNFQLGTGAFNDFGGIQLSSFVRGGAEAMSSVGNGYAFSAGQALTLAQYERRDQDWELQRDQAQRDGERIKCDIIAAQIRLTVAQRELVNHDEQTAQSKEVADFLCDKYSNTELYDWMIGQLSGLYFQCYQLAFDLAKRAEAAYRHELAIDASEPRIIQYGYWNSLHQGLFAGEHLAKDLRRLDKAHMERDVREYELRKSISLAQLDPVALYQLQETGTCQFTLPEMLFDLDHPGHVLRRIRSVSLTIPAVVGPHVSLGARLALTQHSIRRRPGDALEFGYGGKDRIATSTAVSDAGLFNLDFRDERYLPFEYAGAADSSWLLELPAAVRQFDYRTISDVVIALAYTARDGNSTQFRDQVEANLKQAFTAAFAGGAAQLFAVHQAFVNEWARFLAPQAEAEAQVLQLPVTAQHFPYFAQREGLEVEALDFVLLLDESVGALGSPVEMTFSIGDTPVTFTQGPGPFALATVSLAPVVQPGTWALTRVKSSDPVALVTDAWVDPAKVRGLLMLVRYRLQS